MDITGLDWVMKLLDAASATISANEVGSAPTARARLIASGTITMVAPTWLMTSEKLAVRIATATSISHTGSPAGSCSMDAPATQAAAPLLSMAHPSGIRQAIRNTVFQLIAP